MNYGEHLWKLVKSRDALGRKGFRLNLSKEQHYECVCEMFGGEEHIKQEYPDLYIALENSRKKNAGVIGENSETGLQDTACVYDLSEKEGEVRSYGTMMLTQQAERLYLKITLFRDGKEIASDFAFANDACHKMIGCECYVKDLKDDTELSAIIHGTWNPKGTNELQSYVVEGTMQGTTKTAISSVTLYDPVKADTVHTPPIAMKEGAPKEEFWDYFKTDTKDNKTSKVINVCYNRWLERGEVRDYVYPDRNPSGKQGVYLDVRGIIELTGKTYDHFSMANFVLDTKTKGGIFQLAQIKEHHFHAIDGGKKVCFAFPTYWNNEIEGSEMPGFADAELAGEVQFYCRDEHGKVEETVESLKFAHSLNFLEGGSSRQVPVNAIKLLWGCVLEGTMIEMADGSKKRIEDILVGEKVRTSGNDASVSVVVKGDEERIWHLKAEGACEELCVSRDHPIITSNGPKAVHTLTSEDEILLEGNRYSKVEYLYEDEGSFIVYNLLLETENIFYGNGYAAGDQQMQGEIGEKLDAMPPVRKEVEEEIEKLRKEFGK